MLHNVPRIRDVETMIALLADVGAEVEWTGENEVRVQAAEISTHELDAELASRIRASFLLAGPLLARLGRASVPPPGGDVIGRRRLDPHIHAFAELGAEIDIGDALRAARNPQRQAHLPRRGERDGDRERRHGGLADPRRDGDRKRGL